jgi:hypothetical protein
MTEIFDEAIRNLPEAAEPFFEGFVVSMPFLMVFRRIITWKDGAKRKSATGI